MNTWIRRILYFSENLALCLHEMKGFQEDIEKDIQESRHS